MNRTSRALGIPSITTLLASLAAGCVIGDTSASGSGPCGSEVMEEHPLDAFELGQLEASSDPSACMDVCREKSSYEPMSCSWTAYPGAGSSSGDASTGDATGADGSTSSSTGGSSTGGDASSGGASTGDASTGGSSTSDASTSDASTSDDPPTTFGGTFGGSTGGFEGAAGELHCTVWEECVGGRGHASLLPAARSSGADALGEWLAAMAHSEAASVVAFRAIADELAAHGAPAALVRRAHEAADDEVRHAEAMGALARERGVEPPEPRFAALAIRELEALALENAVEGCVRETWAALEACCQARRAGDPALRRAMEGIAVDESRHAQLSWDLDAWARTRLSSDAVARIDAAREQAVVALERGLSTARHELLHERAGIPEPAVARRMLAELRRELWS